MQPSQNSRRKPNRWLLVGGIIGMVLLCFCVVLSLPALTRGMVPRSTTQTEHPQHVAPTATRKVTHKATMLPPTAKPTPLATPVTSTQKNTLPAPSPGPIVLGQPLSHFLAHYGTPMATKTQAQGLFEWQHGALTVLASAQNGYLALTIGYSNTNAQGWTSIAQATPACQTFLPADAVYQRKLEISSPNPETERVYVSQSLAPLFPKSVWTDENGNLTTAGTIGVLYLYDLTNPTHVNECDIQVGL